MPFQSEKQRRYMHANLPDIAKRWERDYSNGGIAELNAELNSLPEYYLPKNQGGRIGFDSGSNGITLGSDKYNITFEPEASGSWTETDLGEGQNIKDKNIAYGVDTTVNIGPVEIGMDYEKFLDKYDVTEDGITVEKDTNRDRDIAYMLGLNLEDLYARIDSDKDFKNWYFTIRKTFSGGGTPAHEAGIYGLAEGGNIRLQPHTASDLLVQETSSGERPKYQPPGHVDAPAPESTPSDVGSGGGTTDDAYFNQQVDLPTTTTTDDKGGWTTDDAYFNQQVDLLTTTDDKGDRIIDLAERKRREDLKNIVAQGEKTEKWEQAQQWNKPNKFVSFIKNAALAIIPGLLPAKMAMVWKAGKGVYDYKTGKMDAYLPAQFRSDGKFAKDIAKTITENAEKRKTDKAELDLINSLPRGHPERIQLEELKKETPDDVHERDGAIQETGTSITIDAEEVNDAKTQLLRKYQEMNDASRLAWQRQQQMNRDKQMAYYRMFRKRYMAAGGRVPAGYNTGGLSNLFKLKNV